MNFIQQHKNGLLLNIKLTPNSSKNEILGYTEDYIKIKVSAPPNENKANKKLIEFISEFLNISKSNIELLTGDKSRYKKILIKNCQEEYIKQKIFIYDKIES
ncbi:YggU family protein [bacterium]|nr:YggU family protein [bacterium]